MKKMLATFSMVGLALSAQALGVEYEFPTDDPELAKVATYPLENFEVGQPEGSIRYNLPKALTGLPVKVEMNKISEHGDLRFYSSPQVEGQCTGPKETPVCNLAFKDLNLDTPTAAAARREAVGEIYANPELRQAALEIGRRFAEDEPIGVIDATNATEALDVTGRWWSASYTIPGNESRTVANRMCFYRSENEALIGEYRVGRSRACQESPCGQCPSACDICGTLDKLTRYGDHLSGRWRVGWRSAGWIDLSFDKDGQFQGHYGMSYQPEVDVPVAGRWWSRSSRR
jgi:hypothetical protein